MVLSDTFTVASTARKPKGLTIMRVYLISTSRIKNYGQSVMAYASTVLERLNPYGLLEILRSETLRSSLRHTLHAMSLKKLQAPRRQLITKDGFLNIPQCLVAGDKVEVSLTDGSTVLPMTFIRRTSSSFEAKK